MKRLNIVEKILFFFNIITALLLLLTYAIPNLDPERFPIINLLSLLYPVFLGLNFFFSILWLIKLKPQFLLSLLVIGIGYKQINSFFSFHKKEELKQTDVKLLSYNVRYFNRAQWIPSPSIQPKIYDFINKQQADIVCIQEHDHTQNPKIKLPKVGQKKTGQNELAIYSKYKPIHTGSLDFKNTANNVLYVDLQVRDQIVRIYNVHLESFGLKTEKKYYGDEDNTALLKHFRNVFVKQSEQIKLLKNHIDNCPYKTIIAGDFNNTAFSWNYHYLMENRKDAFVEAGSGFGKTFNYMFPLRIDFILPDNNMEVGSFANYNVKLSDHYPIMARINLNN